MPRSLTDGWQTAEQYEAERGRCPMCQIDLRHGRAFTLSCTRCAEREAAREDQP